MGNSPLKMVRYCHFELVEPVVAVLKVTVFFKQVFSCKVNINLVVYKPARLT